MKINNYFNTLVDLRNRLNNHRSMGLGFTDNDTFNVVKGNLIRYRILVDYINADVSERQTIPPSIEEHQNLRFPISPYNIGFIEPTQNPHKIVNTPLSRKQARELLKVTIELLNSSLGLMSNVELVDYVARSNKYDYDSILVLLQSVTNYTVGVKELLAFNLIDKWEKKHG